MTEYQNYKNKIQDIKYIFNSGNLDILDLQYILILIHESIFRISNDLQEEVKVVFNQIDFSNNSSVMDINNLQYYIYIFNLIKSDLNNYGFIQNSTQNLMNQLLMEIDSVIPQETEIVESQIIENINERINEQCSGMCKTCGIKCYDRQEEEVSSKELNNIVNKELDEKTQQIIQNEYYYQDNILKDKYLNPNYLKDYLIYNKLIPNECSVCGLNSWQNNYLQLRLDYLDQNYKNQNLSNLRLLCPNCFSQIGYK